MASYPIFDAETQTEVPYELSVDQQSGEVLATSPSGRTLKFPAGLSKKEFKAAVADHQKANEGHEVIPQEELEAREDRLKASNDLVEALGEADEA